MKSKFEKLSKALSLCSINISYYVSKSTGGIVSSETIIVVTRGWVEGGVGRDCLLSYGVSFWRDTNILELGNGDGCIALTPLSFTL